MQKQLTKTTIITLALLCIPLITMQFTDEVNWNAFDFLIAGLLIFTTAILLNLINTKLKNLPYKNLILIVIVMLFLLVWAELAVGILETWLT